MKIRTMLTIAGSDSSGGAGIQADCAAARSLGVFPVCAVSCVTSQGAGGMRMLAPVDEVVFEDQLLAAFEDCRPDAVKIGMMPTERHINILIQILKRFEPANVVLDPIMAPTSGGSDNMTKEMWRDPRLLDEISPYITLFTPNLPESRQILNSTGKYIGGLDQIKELSIRRIICDLRGIFRFRSILLKGGHGNNDELEDILDDGSHLYDTYKNDSFRHPKIDTINTHGTGCALSSLIASRLALGYSLDEACRASVDDLHQSLERNSDNYFYPDRSVRGPAFF